MMLNSHMLQFASAQLDTECANEECSAIGGVSDKVVCVVIGIVCRCGFMLLNEQCGLSFCHSSKPCKNSSTD